MNEGDKLKLLDREYEGCCRLVRRMEEFVDETSETLNSFCAQLRDDVARGAECVEQIKRSTDEMERLSHASCFEVCDTELGDGPYLRGVEMARENAESLVGLRAAVYDTFRLLSSSPAYTRSILHQNEQMLIAESLRDLINTIPPILSSPLPINDWINQETLGSD